MKTPGRALFSIFAYFFFFINLPTVESVPFNIFEDFQPKTALNYPLDDIRVPHNEKNWYFNSQGYLTYSVDETNLRHSYGWWTASGGLEIAPHYWISGMMVMQKYSFSYTVGDGSDFKENFGVRFFPLFSFKGHFNKLLNPHAKHERGCYIDNEAGLLVRSQIGMGLVLAEFNGLGIRNRTQCGNVGIEFSVLGSGYDSGDDLAALHIDFFKRLIQLGVTVELVNPMGNRIVPTLGSIWEFAKGMQLYAEAGFTMHWKTANNVIDINEFNSADPFIIRSNRYLDPNAGLNRGTVLGMVGLKTDFSRFFPQSMRFENLAEFRFYGRQYNNFYEPARYYEFNQPYFVFSDLISSRQPRNFFIHSGEVSAAYLRQDFRYQPIPLIDIIFRNEFMAMSHADPVGGNHTTLVDIFSLRFELVPDKRVRLGIMVSNVLMGPFERNLQQLQPGFLPTRAPFWLEQSKLPMIDFYMRYNLN